MERKKNADRQRDIHSPSHSKPNRSYHWREKIEFAQNDMEYVQGVLIGWDKKMKKSYCHRK
jgi:hypothetical protein